MTRIEKLVADLKNSLVLTGFAPEHRPGEPGTDDSVEFVHEDGREATVHLQIPNAGSGYSTGSVNRMLYEVEDVGDGWVHRQVYGIQQLSEFSFKGETGKVVQSVVDALRSTDFEAFKVEERLNDDDRVLVHPHSKSILEALRSLDAEFAPSRVDGQESFQANVGGRDLLVRATNGVVHVDGPEGTMSVQYGYSVDRSGFVSQIANVLKDPRPAPLPSL